MNLSVILRCFLSKDLCMVATILPHVLLLTFIDLRHVLNLWCTNSPRQYVMHWFFLNEVSVKVFTKSKTCTALWQIYSLVNVIECEVSSAIIYPLVCLVVNICLDACSVCFLDNEQEC